MAFYFDYCSLAPARQASPSKPVAAHRTSALTASKKAKAKSSPEPPAKLEPEKSPEAEDLNLELEPEMKETGVVSSELSALLLPPEVVSMSEALPDLLKPSPPPVPPHSATPPRTSAKSTNTNDEELAVLVDKILLTSDLVIEVVTVIRLEKGHPEPQTVSQAQSMQPGSFDSYSQLMAPLQFGE